MAASSYSSRKPTGFEDLPLELRRRIYEECLIYPEPTDKYKRWIHTWHLSGFDAVDKTSLLLVSKQISEEALEMLYGENVFEVELNSEGSSNLNRCLLETNRRKIRKLQLVLTPDEASYALEDAMLLFPLLPQLTKISIVAQQPLEPRAHYDVPTFQKAIDEWIMVLRMMLERLVPRLSKTIAIEVDDDSLAETDEVLQECLPSGYRRVQTRKGDFLFKRGEYSIESGYWDDDAYAAEVRLRRARN